MLKLILNQTSWGIFGSIFGFVIGFFLKVYVIDIVGLDSWGKYASSLALMSLIDLFISLSIPTIIIKYFSNTLEKNVENSNNLINKFISYVFFSSLFAISLLIIFSSYIDIKIYSKLKDFKFFLVLMSFHIPLTALNSIIISLFRSVLKIKDIILYGTIINIIVRAVATFIVFIYTSNIFYFILIEILSSLLSISLLYYIFHKNIFKFNFKITTNLKLDFSVYNYGKHLFFNRTLNLLSSKSLFFIVSLYLEPKLIAIFSIFLTISGVSMFLNKNLRNIFLPIVSKVYKTNNVILLNNLYKETTFIINIISIPISIIIIFFSSNIIDLFDKSEFAINYIHLLHILIFTKITCLLFGNTGVYMLMAGFEKNDVYIQFVKTIFSILFSIIFIKQYQLEAIVFIFMISSIGVNLFQFLILNKYLKLNPFSKELFFLILLTLVIISIYYIFNFNMRIVFIFPFSMLIFSIYYISFRNKISDLIKKSKK